MIPGMGTLQDEAERVNLQRRDNEDRRTRVDAARKHIYQDGLSITSTHVDDLLKAESLVPTKVCCLSCPLSL